MTLAIDARGFEHNEYLISYFPDLNRVSLDLLKREIKQPPSLKTILTERKSAEKLHCIDALRCQRYFSDWGNRGYSGCEIGKLCFRSNGVYKLYEEFAILLQRKRFPRCCNNDLSFVRVIRKKM